MSSVKRSATDSTPQTSKRSKHSPLIDSRYSKSTMVYCNVTVMLV